MTLHTQTTCSICRTTSLREVVAFGDQPLANAFGSKKRYPLTLMRCENCTHFQLREFIDTHTLYEGYVYRAGTNDMQKRMFNDLSVEIGKHLLTDEDLVVDIGCNDGALLDSLCPSETLSVMGVDPAAPRDIVHHVIRKPWSLETMRGMLPRVIVLTNTFAHLDNLHESVGAIASCLAQDGVCVIQVPWVRDLLANTYYDTIYHEHKHYFSVSALRRLFQEHYMDVTHVDYLPEHGGTIRCWVEHCVDKQKVDASVLYAQGVEISQKFGHESFSTQVEIHQHILQEYCQDGVACFGASAKGVMLMNMADLNVTAVYDDEPEKWGKTVPGLDLKVGTEVIPTEHETPVLLTAWNYADQILPRLKGKRVILPFPFPHEVQCASTLVS